jgi:hypothetical protein
MKKLSLVIMAGAVLFTSACAHTEQQKLYVVGESSEKLVTAHQRIDYLNRRIMALEERIAEMDALMEERNFNNSMTLMGTWLVMAERFGVPMDEFRNELFWGQETAKEIYRYETEQD